MIEPKPSDTSADHDAMTPYWDKTHAILGGTSTMRKAGKKYLPKFNAEVESSYKDRLRDARFTNIFADIVENLAQRPFGTEVTLTDDAPEQLRAFADDVDGCGSNLHVYAAGMFHDAIAYAVDWVLVDYTRGAGPNATIAEERAAGVRPIWRRYPARSVLAAYSAQIDGREQFTHVRLKEGTTVREGFAEIVKERVRVLEREQLESGGYGPAMWMLYEKTSDSSGIEKWVVIDEGVYSIGEIPLVPFIAGRRQGANWRFKPPMQDAAELQIEHYQAENALKNAKNLTAFPMLAGNGVEPELGGDGTPKSLVVGPATVLYTGSNVSGGSVGSWQFIEPGGASLNFLASDAKDIAREMRELGRQPLTAQSGNLTVITTAFAAQKGNSAIQAWALNLIDALENAFRLTSLWLGLGDVAVTVKVDTDFDLGFGDDDSFNHVLAMGLDDGVSGPLISREAIIREAKRRGILGADYDPEEDLEEIMAEMNGNDDDGENGLSADAQGVIGQDGP